MLDSSSCKMTYARLIYSLLFQKKIDMPLLVKLQNQQRPKFPADDITEGYGYAFFTSSYRGTVNVNLKISTYMTLRVESISLL